MAEVRLVEREFKTLEAAIAAIGDRPGIEYMATIDGKKDLQRLYAYNASNLRATLCKRRFNSERHDLVSVWLPELPGADMANAP